jgi:hypothetical protein
MRYILKKNSKIIRTTKSYEYADPWYYDSKGFIYLGHQFANAIIKRNNEK